ncbi:AAA family ATPase [Nonomuraea antimicrobica]
MIASFLERAAADGGALLLLGEPGIGKTTLLDEAADAATASGFRLLRSAGGEFEADVAFSGLNQTLLPLLGELPDAEPLFPALGPAPAAGPMEVATATLSLLRRAARACPLLLLVDDLHRLDRSSAEVLAFVARRLSGTGAGFLAAARPGTADVFDRGSLPVHELERLDDTAASDLLRARFPRLAPRARARVLAEAQGNPLALLELAAEVGGRADCPVTAVPGQPRSAERVRASFAAGVAALPAATRSCCCSPCWTVPATLPCCGPRPATPSCSASSRRSGRAWCGSTSRRRGSRSGIR